MSEFILSLTCEDQIGLVAKVSTFLASAGCNILDAQQFDDRINNKFFMRIAFDPGANSYADLSHGFSPIGIEYGMEWKLRDKSVPPKVLILVSKFDHCLIDLLYRKRIGELDMDVVGIVSNHPRGSDEPRMIEGIPFHHLPITKETKPQQEAQIKQLVEDTGTELVVLARYMQILSPEFVSHYPHQVINIHHSFLPAFVGANPYQQAHDKGVKLIGATSHYVTADLDQGPIIEQNVQRVSHRHSADELKALGQDVERQVMLRAVRWHLEDRVIVDGNKTVVFVK